MSYGDHIYVRRFGYSHHGIDCGDGTVIHFSGEPGKGKRSAAIVRSSMESFAQGGKVRTVAYGRRRSRKETVAAARRRVGESGYNLVWNNCEHFSKWCCTGSSRSEQVNHVASGAGVAAVVPAAAMSGVAVVSATGVAAGTSAAGVMSGLATAGGVVGGGAAAGPAVLAAAPAVVGVGIMHRALRDDESYDDVERKSRRDGRHASTAGAVGALAGTSTAISVAGTTAGLSAAGISSGLAAIGGTVGGGMAAGVGVVVAGPVVAAGALGAGVYFGAKAIRRRRSGARKAA